MSQHHLSLVPKPLDRHLCTCIPVGILGIGLLHKQQWLCLWWVKSWQSSACSTAGRAGLERTVCLLTIPESCSDSCAESVVPACTIKALFQPRGTCCSCCWWISRWEVWKLKAVGCWSSIWALGAVAGRNHAHWVSWRSSEQQQLSWQWLGCCNCFQPCDCWSWMNYSCVPCSVHRGLGVPMVYCLSWI